jgi:hypothetical protein
MKKDHNRISFHQIYKNILKSGIIESGLFISFEVTVGFKKNIKSRRLYQSC